MKYIKTLIIFFLLLLSLPVLGNENFKNISIKEGLSHTDAICVTQDSTGLIWIGTYDGLQSFDGYKLQKYDYYTEKQKIYQAHNRIRSLACTKNHIWLGTESGLTCFNLKTLKYVHYSISDDNDLLNNDKIYKLIFNPKKNLLLIKTARNVLLGKVKDNNINILPWNSDDERIQSKKLTEFSTYNNCIYGGAKNSPYIISIDEKSGKAIIKETLNICKSSEKENIKINKFVFQHEYLYIRTDRGCYRIKMNGNTLSKENSLYLDFNDTDLYNISNNYFTVTANGDLWCASNNGITEIKRPYSNNPTFHKHLDSSSTHDMSVLRINDILIDKYNGIWIASNSRGIFYKTLSDSFFKTISYDEFRKHGFSQNEIVSMCENSDGSIWMVVEYGSIFRYDPSNDIVTKIPVNKPDNIFFQNIYISNDGKHTYIGTNKGLYSYNISRQELRKLNIDDNLDYASISYITKDQFKRIWVSTWGNGLFCISNDINNPKINCHLSTTTDPLITSEWISFIKINNNRIFACTTAGLNCITLGEKGQIRKVSSYQADINKETSLTTDYLVAVDCENDTTCWVGTIGGGLNKLILHSNNNNDYTATSYTTKDGLPNNDCEIVMLDNDNNVWIGGINISCLNTKNGHLDVFSDNPNNKAFKVCVFCKSSNGTFYMGGLYGITGFNPDYPHTKDIECNVYLTELTVNNNIIKPQVKYNNNIILESSIQYTDKIKLNHLQNNFTVAFSTLNSSIPQCTFRYRINGIDNEWSEIPKGSNKVFFSNFPYGKYVLEIQPSTDNGSTWKTPSKKLTIEILPPWWLNIWMKIVYFVVITGTLIFILHHYIKEQNLKKENELQRILIEKDEERYQSKIRFFMNASHELKTPLTLILLSIERITKADEFKKEFNIISSQAKRMMSLISELVDFRKADLGINSLECSQTNISNILRNILNEIKPWLENKKLRLDYTPLSEDIITDANTEKIYKLIINLLSNAIKYTPEEGEIIITLKKEKPNNVIPFFKNSYTEGNTDPDKTACILIVRDTGIGISAESMQMIYERFFQIKENKDNSHLGSGIGLAIVKNIVLQHMGMITISSDRGNGTEFIVTIPLNKKCNNESKEVFNVMSYLNENYNELPVLDDKKEYNLHEDGNKKSILIVEDNKELRDMLYDYFSDKYDIHIAKNGLEGFKLSNSIFPDIIISDVMMPEMDGIEMCKHIKNNLSLAYIPIILLTAKDNIESQIEGYESGADLYLPKPFSMKLLEVNINRLLTIHELNLKGITKNNNNENINNEYNNNDIEIKKTERTEEAEETENSELIEKIKKVIEDNISDANLSPEFIANQLGYSRSNLYRKVKRIDGMSFADYARNYRLEKAAYLLTNSSMNVQEVAYEVGFINTSHFSKVFKLKYGISPMEYKKKV